MKSKVDKLDIGKSETTPVDLSKLSNVVKNDDVKKTEYEDLVKRVNANDTSRLADLLEKQIIMLRSEILKIKYQCY